MPVGTGSCVMSAASWQTYRPMVFPVLLLWGWQADLLWLALAMAAVLEAPRLIKVRVEISQADFDRLWSFSSVLFLAVIFYLALARQGLDAVGALTGAPPSPDQPEGMHRVSGTALTFLRWLPFILFPFTMGVAWSRTTVLPWSTFSLYEQARAKRQPLAPPPEWATRLMHPGYLYVGMTAFAATTTAGHPLFFLPLLLVVLLIAWWPWRNRRYGVGAWAVVLVLLVGVSVIAPFGHQATRAAWAVVEERMQGGGGAFGGGKSNPDQISRHVAFGAIGTLKQSGTIILRATTPDAMAPGLLREASFNRYRGSMWDSHHRDFEQMDAEHVLSGLSKTPLLTITRATADGDTPLALPSDGTALHLGGQAIAELGGLGAVRLRGGLPLAVYQVERGADSERDPAPEDDDLSIERLEDGERAALETASRELGLAGMPVEQAMARIEAWFSKHFTYSLYQDRRASGQGPLARFLGDTHAGHCEYFATATVLLLRSAGIPARYAVGFSMNEGHEGSWIARGRDAHAWCLVWINGHWQDFDTTPGTWREMEDNQRPWLEGLHDSWSDLWHRFDLWRQEGGRWQLIIFIAGMFVLAWIAWRQLRGSTWRRVAPTGNAAVSLHLLGLDSEFMAVLDLLDQHERRPAHVPPARWLNSMTLPVGIDRDALNEALALHERLRFDPDGLEPAQRQRLRELSRALAGHLAATPTSTISSTASTFRPG